MYKCKKFGNEDQLVRFANQRNQMKNVGSIEMFEVISVVYDNSLTPGFVLFYKEY